MLEKIKLYQEVLKIEPNSRVFFALAELLADADQIEEAVKVLRHGLEANPDHLQARFLLIELLGRLGLEDEAIKAFSGLNKILSQYPHFWRIWAKQSRDESSDMYTALSFLAGRLDGTGMTWGRLLELGIDAATSGLSPSRSGAVTSDFAEPKPVEDKGKKTPASEKNLPAAKPQKLEISPSDNSDDEKEALSKEPRKANKNSAKDASIRTKTMADLLIQQDDFEGALNIYEELLAGGAVAKAEKKILAARVKDLRAKLSGDDKITFEAPHWSLSEDTGEQAKLIESHEQKEETSTPQGVSNKLVNILELLADRLEARSGT